MDSSGSYNSDYQKLLHPELLSRNELLEILKSRCVQPNLLEELDKNKLVDLFQRIVIPMPQRAYNNNKRRGKMLNELRSKKKRHISSVEDNTSQVQRKIGSAEYEKTISKSPKNSLDHIVINDRRKMQNTYKESSKPDYARKDPCAVIDNEKSKSSAAVKLKRSDTDSSEKSSSNSNSEEDKRKKRRIVWP